MFSRSGVRALEFPLAYSTIVSTIIKEATPFTLLKTGYKT